MTRLMAGLYALFMLPASGAVFIMALPSYYTDTDWFGIGFAVFLWVAGMIMLLLAAVGEPVEEDEHAD